MCKRLASALAALASLGVTTSALAQGTTTRIEPRPYYGAVVTIEAGVRVFRPLPPTRHVIINPNGTPLNLSLNETRVYERRESTSINEHTHRHFHGSRYHRSRCHPAVGDAC
ncbi:MAG: hypothetical protein NW217_00730 [Hyphomicrobiaceae bacterium]|nr:hypothetical protein [Hyphomicrobiaceae bacterium]